MPPSSSMEVLFLENQPFDSHEVVSLQRWPNLNKLCLYCYQYQGGLLDDLVAAASSIRHITKIVLRVFADGPLKERQIIAMQNALSPCSVERGRCGLTFHRQIEQPSIHADIQRQPPNAQAHNTQASVARASVLENVVHSEPAATIDAEIAQHAVDIQWAEDVQTRIETLGSPQRVAQDKGVYASDSCPNEQDKQPKDLHDSDAVHEKVHLIRFGCNDTEAFRKLLLEGRYMQTCRIALESAGYSCELPGGALMFVTPEQCPEVRRVLTGMELFPYHVIVTTIFESDLQDALSCLAYKKRPREKVKHRREIRMQEQSQESKCTEPEADDLSGQETGDDGLSYELRCERTFLCYAPKLKEPDAVVQSTTEAASRAMNPRRLA